MANTGLAKPEEQKNYRDYDNAKPGVREFYKLNHENQTYDFVLSKEEQYRPLKKAKMGVWDALLKVNTLVDDSDPDTDLSQMDHALQTAEAIRKDGHPDWMIVAGLIHDLGKLLCFYGEPQWAVVGDTFPVGCPYSERIVYPEYFKANADHSNPKYSTDTGVYKKGCGLRNMHMSWGHDEYLFYAIRDFLPDEANAIIRYHSFYAWHKEGAYTEYMDDFDRRMLVWVKKFNPYDLYSKLPVKPNAEDLAPYYQQLLAKYFPQKIQW